MQREQRVHAPLNQLRRQTILAVGQGRRHSCEGFVLFVHALHRSSDTACPLGCLHLYDATLRCAATDHPHRDHQRIHTRTDC